MKRVIIWIISITLLMLVSIPGGYIAYRVYKYTSLFTEARNDVINEKFDEAIDLYSEAVKYNTNINSEVNKKIKHIILLKESKRYYEEAENLSDAKKYIDAINIYKKVDIDDKRYQDAQDKIEKCIELYTNNRIAEAKNYYDNNKYSDAVKTLNDALLVNKDDIKVKSLISRYNEKLTAVNAPPPSPAVPSISVTDTEHGFIIHDGQVDISINIVPHIFYTDLNEISFYIYSTNVKGGQTVYLNYSGSIHYKGATSSVNGKTTSSTTETNIKMNGMKKDGAIIGDYELKFIYKGKEYNFMREFEVR